MNYFPTNDELETAQATNDIPGIDAFEISREKLAAVTKIVNQETDPKATEKFIENEICADWHEGARHQEWINYATPQEIADWLASFYSKA